MTRVNFVATKLPLAFFRPRMNFVIRLVARILATRILNKRSTHSDTVFRISAAALLLQEVGYRVTATEVCNLVYKDLPDNKSTLVTIPA